MSNATFLISILAMMLFAWSIYLGTDRSGKCAFPLWFPLTATSALGTQFWFLSALRAMCARGHGQGSWTAAGAMLAFIFLLPAPVILTISWRCRPRPAAYSSVIVSATVIGYIVLLAVVFVAPSKLDRVPVHLHLVTIDEESMAGAQIRYKTYNHENGYSPSIEDEVTTDSSGNALLFTRRTHWISAFITKNGYSRMGFALEPSYRFGFHQTRISWQGASETDHYQDNQNATIDVPDARELSVKLYVPRKGVDTWLPYPPYNPTWVPK